MLGRQKQPSPYMALVAATFFVDLLGSCRFTVTISPEDIKDIEVEHEELAIYVDAVAPAFSEARQERQSLNAELSSLGVLLTIPVPGSCRQQLYNNSWRILFRKSSLLL